MNHGRQPKNEHLVPDSARETAPQGDHAHLAARGDQTPDGAGEAARDEPLGFRRVPAHDVGREVANWAALCGYCKGYPDQSPVGAFECWGCRMDAPRPPSVLWVVVDANGFIDSCAPTEEEVRQLSGVHDEDRLPPGLSLHRYILT